jgi:hypothetical protein
MHYKSDTLIEIYFSFLSDVLEVALSSLFDKIENFDLILTISLFLASCDCY